MFHHHRSDTAGPPEIPKVTVGPNDLWAALHWLGLHGPAGMVELGGVLRGAVTQLTPAGQGWVKHPQQLPQNPQMLRERFPWNWWLYPVVREVS
ncbi:hypothetical protein [Calidithermus timidus]|jgi:hypothetical protein|uniref:hypothetical protein n=1 Tax=Calidithermus timidus TaxID=307124 RepID=UPI0003755260|nr:hypothetical protein [Calidithermus timidus]